VPGDDRLVVLGLWRRWRPHATIGYEADLIRREQRLASASLPREWRAGGLQDPAGDHDAELWWPPVVVHLPVVAPWRRSAASRAKPYLPPGEKYFGSREGYELTYTSCQESGKYRARLGLDACRTWTRHRPRRQRGRRWPRGPRL